MGGMQGMGGGGIQGGAGAQAADQRAAQMASAAEDGASADGRRRRSASANADCRRTLAGVPQERTTSERRWNAWRERYGRRQSEYAEGTGTSTGSSTRNFSPGAGLMPGMMGGG